MRRHHFTLAFILALPFILAAIASALAHSFYPSECCSGQDCWPTGEEADAREADPVATPAGWRLQDGTVVAFDRTRKSPDGRFHVCRRGGRHDGAFIAEPASKIPCLWAPPQSF